MFRFPLLESTVFLLMPQIQAFYYLFSLQNLVSAQSLNSQTFSFPAIHLRTHFLTICLFVLLLKAGAYSQNYTGIVSCLRNHQRTPGGNTIAYLILFYNPDVIIIVGSLLLSKAPQPLAFVKPCLLALPLASFLLHLGILPTLPSALLHQYTQENKIVAFYIIITSNQRRQKTKYVTLFCS